MDDIRTASKLMLCSNEFIAPVANELEVIIFCKSLTEFVEYSDMITAVVCAARAKGPPGPRVRAGLAAGQLDFVVVHAHNRLMEAIEDGSAFDQVDDSPMSSRRSRVSVAGRISVFGRDRRTSVIGRADSGGGFLSRASLDGRLNESRPASDGKPICETLEDFVDTLLEARKHNVHDTHAFAGYADIQTAPSQDAKSNRGMVGGIFRKVGGAAKRVFEKRQPAPRVVAPITEGPKLKRGVLRTVGKVASRVFGRKGGESGSGATLV